MDKGGDDQNREEQHNRLKALEVQRHRLAYDPAKDYEEWRDEKHDLHGVADWDADHKLHLIPVCGDTDSGVLSCVAEHRQEHEADKVLLICAVSPIPSMPSTKYLAHSYQDNHGDDADCGPDGLEILKLCSIIFHFLLQSGIEEIGL